MLRSNVSDRRALGERTNAPPFNLQSWLGSSKRTTSKRPLESADSEEAPRKRVKSSPDENYSFDVSDACYESDSDVEVVPTRRRRLAQTKPMASVARLPFVSTLPILRSFVSSNKSDVFRCQSVLANSFLTPPYSCSYSHSARRGGAPLLAVATEQGTVYIINTSKRNDWDPEPVYTTLQPHDNGIFDVKWNSEDTLLATGSGDRSARVSDLRTSRVIHTLGHNSTVKCLSWDSTHGDLLAMGGRDGSVSIWDLRINRLPVLRIPASHENVGADGKRKTPKGKHASVPRTVTSLVYSDVDPCQLITSGSSDGILRCWDLRVAKKESSPACLVSSPVDPTISRGGGGSPRPRGIASLALGSGPTTGLIFGLGVDSRIHTYARDSLGMCGPSFTHEKLQTNFYVRIAASPCGRWLAAGGARAPGSSFVFDVSNAARARSGVEPGVELKGYGGDVGGVDWAADGTLSACCDDGIVRMWRPDAERFRACVQQPEEEQWNWCWAENGICKRI